MASRTHTVVYRKTRTTRRLSKNVSTKNANGSVSITAVHNGAEEIFYETSICLSDLDAMAHKAAASKGQVANDGPIRVTIISRNPIQ